MKRYNLLLLGLLAIACWSCKKDMQDPNDGRIRVTEQPHQFVKVNDTISAELSAFFLYPGRIDGVMVRVSQSADFTNATDYTAEIEGSDYIMLIPVNTDTVYYYKYFVHRYSDEFEHEAIWEDETVRVLSTRDVRLPSVTTNDVRFVSQTHALGCGQVTDDEGDAVTERGFCWSIHSKPTIRDYYTSDSDGMGDFYAEMKGMASGEEYYARAYVRNNQGIVYGDPIGFKTKTIGGLLVETLDPDNMNEQSANLKGKLVFSATCSVCNYGFVFGTTPSTNIVQSQFSGNLTSNLPKPFCQIISPLENNTKYYVRAYAVISNVNDTVFGEMKSFTTLSSPFPPTGELNGAFSVSPTQQVQFSPGNLQYQASTNKWRFAQQQWEFVGEGNKNIAANYYGWIDLFGWGTSGHDHGAVCFQPWSTSSSYSDYNAYGGNNYNLNDQTGLADWGSNTIYHNGNATEGWRTLTADEWNYLLNSRNTPSGMRFAKVQLHVVNDLDDTPVNGIVVFPDNWVDDGLIGHPNDVSAFYTSNLIFLNDWKEEYESKGVVFLPAAGRRLGMYYYKDDQQHGYYWSASKYDYRISHLYFSESEFGAYLSYRYYGYSVRLVRAKD